MKKIFLLLILSYLLYSSPIPQALGSLVSPGTGSTDTATAGWTDDGTIVRLNTSSDSVGIGTVNPGNKLEVIGGNIYASGDLFAAGADLTLGTGSASSTLTVIAPGFLGIGSTSPTAFLGIHGNAFIAGTSTTQGLIATSTLYIQNDASNPRFVVLQDGRVGVASSTPFSLFSVHGSSLLAGTTTVYGLFSTSTIIGNAGLTITGTATSTFANGIQLNGGCVVVGGSCLGAGAGTVTSVAVSGGTTGLTTSGGPITTSGTITLAGTLVVGNGGTGATTLASNGVLYGNGTGVVQATSQGGTNSVLTASAGAPSFSTSPTITNLFTTGSSTIADRLSISSALVASSSAAYFNNYYSIASSTFAGTLAVGANLTVGGTIKWGNVTYTAPTADGTSGQALTTNGSGVLSFTTISGGSASSTDLVELGRFVTSSATATVSFYNLPAREVLRIIFIWPGQSAAATASFSFNSDDGANYGAFCWSDGVSNGQTDRTDGFLFNKGGPKGGAGQLTIDVANRGQADQKTVFYQDVASAANDSTQPGQDICSGLWNNTGAPVNRIRIWTRDETKTWNASSTLIIYGSRL